MRRKKKKKMEWRKEDLDHFYQTLLFIPLTTIPPSHRTYVYLHRSSQDHLVFAQTYMEISFGTALHQENRFDILSTPYHICSGTTTTSCTSLTQAVVLIPDYGL
ncbi:unnamed protein product [Caenorhabditis nigoni]